MALPMEIGTRRVDFCPEAFIERNRYVKQF